MLLLKIRASVANTQHIIGQSGKKVECKRRVQTEKLKHYELEYVEEHCRTLGSRATCDFCRPCFCCPDSAAPTGPNMGHHDHIFGLRCKVFSKQSETIIPQPNSEHESVKCKSRHSSHETRCMNALAKGQQQKGEEKCAKRVITLNSPSNEPACQTKILLLSLFVSSVNAF